MKHKTALVLLLVACMSVRCFAQTEQTEQTKQTKQTENANPQEDIKSLRKSLSDSDKEKSKLEKKIEGLKDQLQKAKEENGTLHNQLKREKAEGESAANKDQIKQLKDSIAGIIRSNETLVQQTKADSAKLAETYAAQINELRIQHQKDSTELSRLTEELAQLGEFKAKWLSQLADGVDGKWLSKGYSEIILADLELDYKQYEQYAPLDKKVANARDKLKRLLDEKRIYDNGRMLVSTEYNAPAINDCLTRVKELMTTVTDTQKKEEIGVVLQKLDEYRITLKIFHEVIGAVDHQLQDQESHFAAWPLAKSVIDKYEKDYEYISAIKDIPWLAEQWEEYYKCLSKDCFGANPARDRIKLLVP